VGGGGALRCRALEPLPRLRVVLAHAPAVGVEPRIELLRIGVAGLRERSELGDRALVVALPHGDLRLIERRELALHRDALAQLEAGEPLQPALAVGVGELGLAPAVRDRVQRDLARDQPRELVLRRLAEAAGVPPLEDALALAAADLARLQIRALRAHARE